jgi:hypothetical protein
MGRDANAANNIAISGASILLSSDHSANNTTHSDATRDCLF